MSGNASLCRLPNKAAEVYARGNYFSECLTVCTKGDLFDMGLQYIQCWKQHALRDHVMAKRSSEIAEIEQQFIESCALHYYELKDNKSTMKFVRAINSMDSRRKFLKSLNCLDELLIVEDESVNFSEAAEIAKVRGDILLEGDFWGELDISMRQIGLSYAENHPMEQQNVSRSTDDTSLTRD